MEWIGRKKKIEIVIFVKKSWFLRDLQKSTKIVKRFSQLPPPFVLIVKPYDVV